MKKIILFIGLSILIGSGLCGQTQVKLDLIYNETISLNKENYFTSIGIDKDNLFLISRKRQLSLFDTKSQTIKQLNRLTIVLDSVLKHKLMIDAFYVNEKFIAISSIFMVLMDRNSETYKNKLDFKGDVFSISTIDNNSTFRLVGNGLIKIQSLQNKVIDSLKIYNFSNSSSFSASPYLNFFFNNQTTTFVPYSKQEQKILDKELMRNKDWFNKYSVKFFPFDKFEDYLPKTVSKTNIYWLSIKEPNKMLVTPIDNYEKFKIIVLDKTIIDYKNTMPELIEMSEGGDKNPDYGSVFKITNNYKGTFYFTFRGKDNKMKI